MSAPTVIVTGASRGVGLALVHDLAARDINVVMFARSSEALETIDREIDGPTHPVAGDVASATDRERLVRETLRRFGAITGLVNNAATLNPLGTVATMTAESWDHAMAVNLIGPVALTALALPALRESRGRVINVSSGAAVRPIAGAGAYCAAKAALMLSTFVLAEEEPTVTALAVRPGVVDTAMQSTIRTEGASRMPPTTHERFVGLHEGGELLDPAVPARALAALVLGAPNEWSGEHLGWDDEKVAALAARG